MAVASTTKDAVTVVSPTGVIDTRTAQAFEATMVQAFGSGARAFAIDLGKVTLITSAGIRVLVMMSHRLQRVAGGLVLFGLSDRVKTVFEIGGLLQQFAIVDNEPQAMQVLSVARATPASATARPSRLASLVFDVVCAEAALHEGLTSAPAPSASSAVTTAIVDTLAQWTPEDDTALSPG